MIQVFGFIFLLIFQNLIFKKKDVFLLVSFLEILFLLSFRSLSIGNDTISYYVLFNNIKSNSIDIFNNQFEIGFLIYNFLLSRFLSFRFYLLITNIIILYPFFILVKKYSKNYLLSILLFVFYTYFSLFLNTLRLAISISISLISYLLILNQYRNKIVYYVLSLLAFLFHYSSIFFFLFLLIEIYKFKRFLHFFVFLPIIFYIFKNEILNFLVYVFPKYSFYIESEYLDGSLPIAVIFILILNVFIHYYSNYLRDKTFLSLHYFMILMISFGLAFNLFVRISDFFSFSILILIPEIFESKSLKASKLITFAFTISIICWFILIIYFRPEWNNIIPFSFF